jgi:hypothetical protein
LLRCEDASSYIVKPPQQLHAVPHFLGIHKVASFTPCMAAYGYAHFLHMPIA